MTKTRQDYEKELGNLLKAFKFSQMGEMLEKVNKIFDAGLKDKVFTADEVLRWQQRLTAPFSMSLRERLKYLRAHAHDLVRLPKDIKELKKD